MTKRVLLVQIRDEDDHMAGHEHECVHRRVGAHRATVVTRNALVEPATPSWLDGFDVLVIGGSGDYSVHHARSQRWVTPLRHLLEGALERAMPGFGICFGHQLLGLHLGGEVQTDPDRTEIGTTEFSLTDAGRDCDVFGFLGERFIAQTGHSDHVNGAPPDLEVLVTNDTIHTQAFKVKGRRFYSTQFHPDLSASEARYRYLRYRENMGQVTDDQRLLSAEKYDPESDGSHSERLLAQFLDSIE